MAGKNSVIQMWTATVGDAAASIDMQDDGTIMRAYGFVDLTSVGADGDGAHTLHEHILVSTLAPRLTFWNLLLKNLN